MILAKILFPKKCVGCGKQGDYFCQQCLVELPIIRGLICPMCGRGAVSGRTHAGCQRAQGMDGLVSLFCYTGMVRRVIKKLKFRWVTDLVEELIDVMMSELETRDFLRVYFVKKSFLVMPVPLHSSRERWRGFNQAAEIGKRVADLLSLQFLDGAIKRTRKTDSQAEMKVELTARERDGLRKKATSRFDYQERVMRALREKKVKARFGNIRGAFRINPNFQVSNFKSKNILIVDDVWTSGATMKECAKVLKRAGVGEVWGLTIAR